jgi:hypothetical protein
MCLLLVSIITGQGVAVQAVSSRQAWSAKRATLIGRWRVKFTLIGGGEKNLVFEARPNGSGSFMLLDTGLNDKPVAAAQPAAWSQTTDNASISGEVELPIGTCCRETGTLIFKAKIRSSNSISGTHLCYERRGGGKPL